MSYHEEIAEIERGLAKIYISGSDVIFDHDIDKESVHKLIKLLLDDKKINRIILTTYGGDVNQGLKLVSFIKGLGRKIDIKIAGYAMSMGPIIMASATGKKIISRDSMLMYHEPSTFSRGYNTTNQLRDKVEYLNFLDEIARKIINPKNNPKINDFLQEVVQLRKDVYITAGEALDIGLVDQIE